MAYAGTLDFESGKVEISVDGIEPEQIVAELENEGGEPVIETAEEQPIVQEAVIESKDPVTNTIDYLKSWNEKAGTHFQNDDEIINEVKAGRALKAQITEYEQKLKEYSDLDDPMVRDIAKARKAGIGLELYLEAVKMDPEKLDDDQALREAFFRKNAELVATQPKLAQMKFERELKAKYGDLGATLNVESLSGLDEFEVRAKTLEFNQEQEFLRMSKAADVAQDKNYLKDWKAKHITIPDVPQQAGMTDQQIQQLYQQVDSFVGQKDKIEIPIGDKKFNFSLKDYGQTLNSELRDLHNTLKKHGLDYETGNVDINKIGQLLIDAYVGRNIAKPLSDWSIDARNLEYLKTKKEQPAPSQPIAGGAPASEDDLAMRFAKGIKAQREAQSQS